VTPSRGIAVSAASCTATIDEAGRMVTADGAVFLTPDTCESTIAGYPCKGWRNWRTATGETLQQLREMQAAAESSARPVNTPPPTDILVAAGGCVVLASQSRP
jgi:hypothetical protein